MVYTDGIHLVADTLEELHQFAKELGLKKHWFHGMRKGHPHYDLPMGKLIIPNKLLDAMVVTTREIVKMFQDGRLKTN